MNIVILIAANIEWEALTNYLDRPQCQSYPFGEYFFRSYSFDGLPIKVRFVKVGWGKISSSAATQFVIDHWQPAILINLGTCGGIEGRTEVGEIIMVEKTIIYDLHVAIADEASEIAHYTVDLITPWMSMEIPVLARRGRMLSGDRDLRPEDIAHLVGRFEGIAADWESGAIAYVASRNNVPLIILRYVTDLVSHHKGEVYGDSVLPFEERVIVAMRVLEQSVPGWIAFLKGL